MIYIYIYIYIIYIYYIYIYIYIYISVPNFVVEKNTLGYSYANTSIVYFDQLSTTNETISLLILSFYNLGSII